MASRSPRRGVGVGHVDLILVVERDAARLPESDDVQNPGWEEGIRIGDAKSGWVHWFIQFPWGDPRTTAGNGAEFVAVDRDGNIYGGEPAPKRLQKYVRVRP